MTLIGLVIAGCGARVAETKNPNVIVTAWIAGPDSFNPLTAIGSAARMVNYEIYTPLIAIGPNLLPRWSTSLAYRVDMTNGGRRYVLHLRPGVRWSDGVPLTAKDVAFSLLLGNNPLLLEGNSADFKLMQSARALDRYTVEVRLSSPSPPFLENALGETIPLPEHILGRYPPGSEDEAKFVNTNASFAQSPIISGPFRIVRNVRGSYLILGPNPLYWGPKPRLQEIAFRVYPIQDSLYAAVDAGEIDVTDIPPNLWRIHKRLRGAHRFITWPWNVTFLLLPNYHDPENAWAHDPRVKQAMMYAINRDFIRGGIMSGQADILNGPIPTFSPYYNPHVKIYSYDPAKARRLLDAAGWRLQNGVRSKGGKPLRFTLKTGGATDAVASDIAELIQANFRAVGIECALQNEELQTFFQDLHNSKFQMALRGIILQPYPDDYRSYDSTQTRANGGYNIGFYSNPAVDRAIESARTAADPTTARRELFRYQQIASEDLPVIYLYSVRLGAVVPPDLRGYDLDPLAPAALPMGLQFWHLSRR
ncbi:MAG TPA: peptide ABC transporter substrate-binding protein [Candidatus Rubrimentiphilum sp.]|nr:peptide ABC transporter substrate-binding protein [Candidatus Rubrimentiphilum sp.]